MRKDFCALGYGRPSLTRFTAGADSAWPSTSCPGSQPARSPSDPTAAAAVTVERPNPGGPTPLTARHLPAPAPRDCPKWLPQCPPGLGLADSTMPNRARLSGVRGLPTPLFTSPSRLLRRLDLGDCCFSATSAEAPATRPHGSRAPCSHVSLSQCWGGDDEHGPWSQAVQTPALPLPSHVTLVPLA